MNGHLKLVITLVIVGILVILGYRFTWPYIQENYDLATTDAGEAQTKIRIGMDNWVGYFPLCSPEMKRRLRSRSIQLQCIDDQADYAERFRKLKKGELEFSVATIDSYILNGHYANYPGVIIAVIDESKGGDAIVARNDMFQSLSDLNSDKPFKVAYTPDSPSEHLLKTVSTHFDIKKFRSKAGSWRLESDGSNDALDKLLSKKADVAVLWEPDVSRALARADISKLISTADTDKLIIDILLVAKDYLREHSEAVDTLVKTYFETLKYYHLNPDLLREDIKSETSLKKNQITAMLNGVSWVGMTENAVDWFGITDQGIYGDEALINAINAALDILIDHRDFDSSPLPQQDPYRLTNRHIIQQIYENRSFQGQAGAPSSTNHPARRKFGPLDNDAWDDLKEIGTLKIDPVSFRRGSALLDPAGEATLDQLASRLKRYPNFRILIKGHTGIKGDSRANLELSADRAAAVSRYLSTTVQMDNNRIHSIGYGSSRPLAKLQGESARAYSYRLPRVEIALVTEAY